MTILGADVSHFQGSPNFAQVKASGLDFVVLKATESTNFTDPNFAANRKAAHAAGLIVGAYHFARAGNVAAEAAYFVRTVGALQPGEFLVLDQEVPNSVGWCQQWLDAVFAATGVRPLIYMNQSVSTGVALGDWSPVAKNYGLWLAKYDNAPGTANTVPHWGSPAMKQYSDKGSVPGIAGPVDVDVFYGTVDQLLAYCKGGSPTPLEVDMELSDTIRFTRPDNGVVVTYTVGECLAWTNWYAGQAATNPPTVKGADPTAWAAAVVQAMGTGFAQQVIDALGQRINADKSA